MGMRKLAVLATIVTSVSAGALPAEATTQASWYPVLLQMPAGYPGTSGEVTGTDGKGGYAGIMRVDNNDRSRQIVTWKNGEPTVRGGPSGYEYTHAVDENSSGIVLGNAWDFGVRENRGFTLDAHGFHMLTPPEGLSGEIEAVAINDRGDVVGTVGSWAEHSTVLWPASGAAPTVIPNVPQEYARGLDSDGTILIDGPSGAYLWRSGVIEKLVLPAGFDTVHVTGIRNGSVVGDVTAQMTSRAVLWRTPSAPEQLPGGFWADSINKSGLIVGNQTSSTGQLGKLTTWQGTNPAGILPTPGGFIGATAYRVGDDGVIVGYASHENSDVPVIWQRTG